MKRVTFNEDDVKLAVSLIEKGNIESGLAIFKGRLQSKEVLPEIADMKIGDMLIYPANIHMRIRNKARNLMMKYIDRHYIVNKRDNQTIIRRFK